MLPFYEGGLMDLTDEIAQVAYELFEKDGKQHGKDKEHWLEAERIVNKKHNIKRVPAKPVKAKATQDKAKTKSDLSTSKDKTAGKVIVKAVTAKAGKTAKAQSSKTK